jgi:hypothetical protein
MKGMRRQRRLTGRFSLVDGIPFELPVNSVDNTAFMAAFTIDTAAAAALLPGNEIYPLRVSAGRALLVVTVIDYVQTDIGKYIEFSVAIACTNGKDQAPPILPGVFPWPFGIGQFVIDLPVSTEISVKGGKGIWGMPKHQANLDYVVTDDRVSSQYDLDGVLVMRIDIARPQGWTIPLRFSGANYCTFRGLLMKSYIHFKGKGQFAAGGAAKGTITLGDHPRLDVLRDLDRSDEPVFTAFFPTVDGVLDDYFEAWMITEAEPPQVTPEGMETVIDLGLGQDWLEPPKRRDEP